MKKKIAIISIAGVSVIGVAFAAVILLGSHEHTFDTKWSIDATNHWHKCTDSECTEVSENAAHTWNDGEITKEATAESKGTKTFTCTACNATKAEDIEFIEEESMDS